MKSVEANPEKETILIRSGPKTRRDAVRNFLAFSDEGRRLKTASQNSRETEGKKSNKSTNRAPPPPFPTFPKCFGWIRVPRDVLPKIDPPVWKKVDEQFDCHWAIIYEFVPKASKERGGLLGERLQLLILHNVTLYTPIL